ncbi:uncharacterized protein SPSK_01995 [Sporothrix schenckii 1099-18]|uniref:Uncharacterized protein n=2 Tax=Sporothrix schenckii TaxID=29908 RepID=U7PII1_SPOS1|nr:uncharacterized protein SPSK_01995 [Sporothrix schenckii 1099-18]ERS95398.1 hypothetical protein HMPREF1624_08276 [Sporothrix schenckii ATCC 58251]KJR87479.1 hypothetical protein SPSK_01995 [Sporothrix schenckii 1099-18]
MYCQLHRPVTSGSQVACALGHIGDRIYWIQKGFFLPDALGIVPPPYFPILHVGITALVSILLFKAIVLDPLQELNCLSVLRRRSAFNAKLSGPGGNFFLQRYWRQVLRTFCEIFIVSSMLNIIFLFIFRNNETAVAGDQNPDIYSQIMRNKLNRYGIIF